MNRFILSVLGLLLAWTVRAQGPPTKVSPFTVEKSARFGEIPTPMQSIDPGKYAPEAANATGFVQLNFPKAKAGKFKKGGISMIVRDNIVTSVTLDAPSGKAVKFLMKQMIEQFGDPYKLQSSQEGQFITWFPGQKGRFQIQFRSNQDFTEAAVTIEMR